MISILRCVYTQRLITPTLSRIIERFGREKVVRAAGFWAATEPEDKRVTIAGTARREAGMSG